MIVKRIDSYTDLFTVSTILKDFFVQQFANLNQVFLLLTLLLIGGLLVAWFAIWKVKKRLITTNEELNSLRHSNDLALRLSTDKLSGPLYNTISQMNLMLEAIEQQVEITRSQASNIAHDLRTPLTVAYQNICALQTTYPELDVTENSIRHILSTFNVLLKINRMESKGEQLILQRLPVRRVIEDVLDLYMPALEEKQQVITLQVDENLYINAHS